MACNPTEIYSLTTQLAAADFNAPNVLKLAPGNDAFEDFPVPYELLGITLVSTLTNFGTAIMGVFVLIKTNTPTVTYSKSTPALIGHATGQNSIVGPPALAVPSDKSIAKVFLQPVRIPANSRISLYAFGDNTVGNAAAAFVMLDVRKASEG